MQWDDIQIYNFYYNLNLNLNSSVSDHNNGIFQVTYDHPRLFSYCKLFHLGVGWKRNIKRIKKVFLLSFNAIKIDELSHTFMFHILSPFFYTRLKCWWQMMQHSADTWLSTVKIFHIFQTSLFLDKSAETFSDAWIDLTKFFLSLSRLLTQFS